MIVWRTGVAIILTGFLVLCLFWAIDGLDVYHGTEECGSYANAVKMRDAIETTALESGGVVKFLEIQDDIDVKFIVEKQGESFVYGSRRTVWLNWLALVFQTIGLAIVMEGCCKTKSTCITDYAIEDYIEWDASLISCNRSGFKNTNHITPNYY